ncbi:hypothetical protein FXO37_12543 [Capsicum annuum]|nr:hypothetical protein FXO37_12543 [Capsicum annuum]
MLNFPWKGEPLSDPGRYRRLVGKLNYLTVTRPDMFFPVSVVSQFINSPSDSHWDAIVRILRYIKSSSGKGLLFEIGYTDADWALPSNRCSTSRYCVLVGGALRGEKRLFNRVILEETEVEVWHRRSSIEKFHVIWYLLWGGVRFAMELVEGIVIPDLQVLNITSIYDMRFASRMLAWILRRAMGASVSFRVGGWKCLRDVVVKFNKAEEKLPLQLHQAQECTVTWEVPHLGNLMKRLNCRQDPKLQVLICDLEVVMRASSKSIKKAKSRKSRKSGRGKWMVVANMTRFLSVTVTELVVKTPKATVEVKELTLDLSKDGRSKPELFVKLLLAPIFVHFGESRVSYDQSSVYAGSFPSNDGLLAMTEKVSAPFSCEEFSITCEFGHDREAGVVVRNVDIATGDVSIILNDELLFKRKGGDAFSSKDVAIKAVTESGTAEKPVKTSANLAIMKYASMFPEKLCFMLPKLDVKFVHREVALMVENNIMGIQLKGTKSRSFEDVGESKRVDVQMEFSEIHLLKDGGISVVEILKLDVVSSSYIPLQGLFGKPPWVVHSHHVFANNISSTGTVVHMELGEFNLNMSDEYRECLKESLFGVETNMGSLIYIAKVSVDWGKKDMDSPEDSLKYKTVLSVDVTGMGVHLTFRRIGSLVSTALSFKRLLKSLSGSGKKPHNRVTKSSKPSGKGIQLLNFNLEKCYLNVCGEVGLENSVVPDPKRANCGSQGGRIVVCVSANGTPRTATITPTAPVELKKLKYSLSLDIFHLNLTLNEEKQSTQMKLERARSIYQEHLEDNNLPGARVTLLDMQNAKFVR